jgi:hypothetical protein
MLTGMLKCCVDRPATAGTLTSSVPSWILKKNDRGKMLLKNSHCGAMFGSSRYVTIKSIACLVKEKNAKYSKKHDKKNGDYWCLVSFGDSDHISIVNTCLVAQGNVDNQ